MTHFLYLVRHGEAVPHDGPLSPAGERQAQLTFNDAGHLTPELRWSGFPAAVRPASG